MPVAAIVTIIGVGLLIAALAVYLVIIAIKLRGVVDTLGKVTFGVRAIAYQTRPVNELVAQIEADLRAIDEALGGVLERARVPAGGGG